MKNTSSISIHQIIGFFSSKSAMKGVALGGANFDHIAVLHMFESLLIKFKYVILQEYFCIT